MKKNQNLMNMEMREGEPMDTVIRNWQRKLNVAISAGNIIDETSKCEILMGSLPESWITFMSIHSNEKDINAQILIAKIKQEELRRKKPNRHKSHGNGRVHDTPLPRQLLEAKDIPKMSSKE